MSDWLRLINEIKQRPPEEQLTPTQRAVFQVIYDLLRYPQWINLYGASGSGKTFVAWALARATGGIHLPIPSALYKQGSGNEILFIDNAPHAELDVRNLLARANLLDVSSVVLITRLPVTMPMRRVELVLPEAHEVSSVQQTFKRWGFLPHDSDPNLPSNFWTLLNSCI